MVDTEDDPDNVGKRRMTFRAVEGIVAPSEPPLAGETIAPVE